MKQEKKNTAQKKRYVKPKLEAVMLFADEVMGVCKLDITIGCTVQTNPRS